MSIITHPKYSNHPEKVIQKMRVYEVIQKMRVYVYQSFTDSNIANETKFHLSTMLNVTKLLKLAKFYSRIMMIR